MIKSEVQQTEILGFSGRGYEIGTFVGCGFRPQGPNQAMHIIYYHVVRDR